MKIIYTSMVDAAKLRAMTHSWCDLRAMSLSVLIYRTRVRRRWSGQSGRCIVEWRSTLPHVFDRLRLGTAGKLRFEFPFVYTMRIYDVHSSQ